MSCLHWTIEAAFTFFNNKKPKKKWPGYGSELSITVTKIRVCTTGTCQACLLSNILIDLLQKCIRLVRYYRYRVSEKYRDFYSIAFDPGIGVWVSKIDTENALGKMAMRINKLLNTKHNDTTQKFSSAPSARDFNLLIDFCVWSIYLWEQFIFVYKL